MIIETYKDGDVVSFKLARGEEIVARLDKETTSPTKLTSPMVLIVQADESMGPSYVLRWLTGKFEMQKFSVASYCKD